MTALTDEVVRTCNRCMATKPVSDFWSRPSRTAGCDGTCKSCRSETRKASALSAPEHGYGAYSNGCRCETCRSAKAAYMAERRAFGRQVGELSGRRTDIPTHGTRAAYEEHGCRCQECTDAQVTSSRRPAHRRRAA